MKSYLDGNPHRDRLIPLLSRREMPLFNRIDSSLVDILVQRFDDMDILRLALGTHNQPDQHSSGDAKPTVVVRLVYGRNLVGNARRSNSGANVKDLLVVNRGA